MPHRLSDKKIVLKLKSGLSFLLPIGMLAVLPSLTDWLLNRYQVTLIDLALPLLIALFFSVVVGGIFYKLYQKDHFSGYVGALLTIFLLTNGYDDRLDALNPLLKALLPLPHLGNAEGIIMGFLFDLLVAILAFVISSFTFRQITKRGWNMKNITGGIIITISVAFFIQAFTTVQVIIKEWPQFFYRPPQLSLGTTTTSPAAKPDIYYIVLDRYTNQEVMQNQLGFDNAHFMDFLHNQQFYVNPSAHSNYPYTTMSVSATLNATYHTDTVQKFGNLSEQILEPYHDSIRYSPVITDLKSLGYSYYHLGTWYEASNQAPLADHYYQPDGQLTVFGHTFTLNSFSKNNLTESAAWPFIEHGLKLGKFSVITYSGQSEVEATKSKLSVLNQIAAGPSGGRFIFAHLLIPHDPYYFNADGSLSTVSGSDDVGKPIKQKYIDQVQFINGQMQSLLTGINQHSHNQAVVVLQADEGPYPMILNGENFDSESVGDELSTQSMLQWSDADLQMKYGVLAAYHVPGASSDELAQAGDSVNIFRLIFNKYFGSQLAYLPRCYYAYANGREQSFVYSDITDRLTGSANAACSADSSTLPQ